MIFLEPHNLKGRWLLPQLSLSSASFSSIRTAVCRRKCCQGRRKKHPPFLGRRSSKEIWLNRTEPNHRQTPRPFRAPSCLPSFLVSWLPKPRKVESALHLECPELDRERGREPAEYQTVFFSDLQSTVNHPSVHPTCLFLIWSFLFILRKSIKEATLSPVWLVSPRVPLWFHT